MTFEKNIISLYGQAGQEWLDNLPNLVEQLSINWNLSNLKIVNNLSYNYVLSGFQKNTPIILKLFFDKVALEKEASALKYFDGHGCVKLLYKDVNLGALLLEQIVPGTSLKSLFPTDDQKAIEITCKVIKDLQNAVPKNLDGFKNISEWLSILDQDWDIPKEYLEKARSLSEKLLATTKNQILLHADLHHENILLNEQGSWLAIDPKGVVGDPVFEVGAFIRNPIPDLLELEPGKVNDIIENRINLFSKLLNFDKQRIADWSFVQVVLAACWAKQDNLDSKYYMNFIEIVC